MSLVDFELSSSANPGRPDRADRRLARLGVRSLGRGRDHHLGHRRVLRLQSFACPGWARWRRCISPAPSTSRSSERRKSEVMQLLALVNEQLWLGHFDLWQAEGVIMYRNALLLTEGMEAGTAQLEAMLAAAVEACERYYQAFQFVIWAGKTPGGRARRRAFRDARRSLSAHARGRAAPAPRRRRQDGRRHAGAVAGERARSPRTSPSSTPIWKATAGRSSPRPGSRPRRASPRPPTAPTRSWCWR